MCPYARFQSAMFDPDTLVITYDAARGEPRGSRPRKADGRSLGKGDCVDCGICVQVCPTGIDIRKGLQYECIGCAACIDGCDQVMEKMGYAPGLIRYSTQNALAQGWGWRQMLRRVTRTRVLVYTAVLAAIACALAAHIWLRVPVKMDVIRDRGSLARELDDGRVENVYRLQLMTTAERPQRLALSAAGGPGLEGLEVVAEGALDLPPTTTRMVAVRVRAHPRGVRGSQDLRFILDAGEHRIVEKSRFLIP
jgi:cytochrome c oxidase accessory protein FixG